ncbi:MAG: hypothetical protein GC192_00905 [Bacteroidetes bacterium]|nr:hypothetical protein [Bacteroidota bacterium]
MKKAFWKTAIFLTLVPAWLFAQEVITNEDGRKIVVEADGQWHYFQVADSLTASIADSVFRPPQEVVDENQQRIAESQQYEKELSMSLIKTRVELVDRQLALGNAPPTEVRLLKEQLAQTEQQLEQLKKDFDLAAERTVFLQKIANLPPATYARKLKKWEQEHPQKSGTPILRIAQTEETATPPTTSIANGILFLPPKQPCAGGRVSTDSETGNFRWDTSPTKFFSHTDEAVENQFPKRDFIECVGRLTGMEGGRKFLNLEIAIASPKAPQIVGTMPKGEFIEIQLLNGEIIRLFNNLPNNGQWVASQEAYIFMGNYTIGIKEEKMLKNNEVDKVLVRWSLVQEKYAVFETDFFMRQFQCLEALILKNN